MAIDLISRIPDRTDLDSYEKLVLIIMADRADEEGLLWYANETIARKCSMTVRGVQKVLDRLIGMQLVKKMHRHDRSNFYILVVDNLPHVERPARPAKERGPIDYLMGEQELDLFARGEHGSRRRGERGSARHEPGSIRGEPGSPDSLIDTDMTPVPSSDELLRNYVGAEWDALVVDYPDLAARPPMTDARARAIIRRTDERLGKKAGDAEKQALWELVFEQIRGSKLLLGMKTDWSIDFDWMLTKSRFGRIVEKQYGNGPDRVGTAGRSDRSSVDAGRAALDIVRGHRERSSERAPAG